MERDLKKIIETLQKHEADNVLLNDVLLMLLNNQINSTKATKKALLQIKENVKSEHTNNTEAINIIKNFVVDLAERLIVLERKL
tara:strand:- start:168 stop:419 length:252 start_codon:yes stop_codon:yes gene_type:complete